VVYISALCDNHLERQLVQCHEHIRLLNQLQHETEGHVSDLRQKNEQCAADLAEATADASKVRGALCLSVWCMQEFAMWETDGNS
jgi:hypothetical protein